MSIYLFQRKRVTLPVVIPMIFMMVVTVVAMVMQIRKFMRADKPSVSLIVVAFVILGLAFWLIVEAGVAFRKCRRNREAENSRIPEA